MLKIISAEAVDMLKFERLRKMKENDVFSKRAYFETLCPYWSLLVLNDYEAALLIPYNQKMHYQWVVTPLYYRASAWLGSWSPENQSLAIRFLQNQFTFGTLNVGEVAGIRSNKIYQCILPESFSEQKFSNLTKRMLKKADSKSILFTSVLDIDQFVFFLKAELGSRIDGVDDKSMKLLSELLKNMQKEGILGFEGAVIGGEFVGGILTLISEQRHLYLKGTATKEAKKDGIFYKLMHRAIQKAVEDGATFDFGGSSIAGVAQFNRNFGAEDVAYYTLNWGKEPIPFRIYNKLRRLWK
jgi:hypothetical protein